MKNLRLLKKYLLITLMGMVTGCGGSSSSPTASQGSENVLSDFDINELKNGGYVVLFRHLHRDAETGNIDQIDREGVCVVGSQLSDKGKNDAAKLKDVFDRYGVIADQIYTSPSCRTRQMASIVFGREGIISMEAARQALWSEKEYDLMAQLLRLRLSQVPNAGKNNFIIGHAPFFEALHKVTYSPLQGDAAVFRPNGDDFEFVGLLRIAVWSEL